MQARAAAACLALATLGGAASPQSPAADSWWSDGIAWHAVLNVGDTTAIYLIVEPRPHG